MIDLSIEQNKAFNNVLRRDLPIDLQSMTDHLKSEVKEFERAPRMNNSSDIEKLSNIQDDKEFLLKHKLLMKDTKEGEIGDILVNALSVCDCINVDAETILMVTQRANSLRKD